MAAKTQIRPPDFQHDDVHEDIVDVQPLQRTDPVWVEPGEAIKDALPVPSRPARIPWAEPAPPRRGFFVRAIVGTWSLIASVTEWLFGVVTLIVGLAVLAALPIAGFLSLGYLLEAGGRIGRTGRFREGFLGVRKAARVGTLVAGTWLMLLPLRAVSSMLATAQIIEAEGLVAQAWRTTLLTLTVGMAIHIALSALRGGRLRYFFWPVGNLLWAVRHLGQKGTYAAARDAVWDFVVSLRLPYYFWLGLRGFLVGFVWLAVPVTLMGLSRRIPVFGFVGGGLLVMVLLALPFLQMHFAAEGRLRAGFAIGQVLSRFGRAPWAFLVASFFTFLLALPLYLLKIEAVPREAAWLPGLFFIVFIFPSRLLAGWAYARSQRRAEQRHWFFAATGLLLMMPSTVVYVFFVYLTQFTSWDGVWTLYEQHAFLLPVPQVIP